MKDNLLIGLFIGLFAAQELPALFLQTPSTRGRSHLIYSASVLRINSSHNKSLFLMRLLFSLLVGKLNLSIE